MSDTPNESSDALPVNISTCLFDNPAAIKPGDTLTLKYGFPNNPLTMQVTKVQVIEITDSSIKGKIVR